MATSEALLAGIIASAMDAVITVDSEQRVTLFNKAAEKMFRLPAAEALGQPLDRFIPPRFRAASPTRRRCVPDWPSWWRWPIPMTIFHKRKETALSKCSRIDLS